MNKQELIEGIEAVPAHNTRTRSWIDKKIVLGLIRQLDEPQPVEVPKFVADWIETAKKATYNIRGAIEMVPKGRIEDWLELKNVDTFAEAWVNGYTVEEEKRYLVKVKGICGNHETLNREKHSNKWLFSDREENSLYNTKFTRKELEEAGFGWIFSCEGIEIEEVTE
nr:MAG TPA: Protein of unknown function (DUF1642) [Caudoviricetes sp.]